MEESERIEGAVSLWVGVADSMDAMDKYTEMDYTTGTHLSPFALDFDTGWYDHDFMDAYVCENRTRSLPDLLRGCSYDAVILPEFVELCGELLPEPANAVILLYNFRQHDCVAPKADGAVRLHYMGSISVKMPWAD